MTPHQLGQALRLQVLTHYQRLGRVHGQGLEAVINDLCGDDHLHLRPPLHGLVSSSSFVAAVGRDASLADPALLDQWGQELARVYTPELCQQLRPVLQGLLNQPEQLRRQAVAAPAAPPPAIPPLPRPANPAVPRRPVPPPLAPGAAAQARRSRPPLPVDLSPSPIDAGGKPVLLTLMAFGGGVVLALMLALGLGLRQRLHRSTGTPPLAPPQAPATVAPPVTPSPQPAPAPVEAAAPQPDSPAASSTAPTDSNDSAAAQAEGQRAISSVQGLYDALTAKDYGRARRWLDGASADQFDPSFFDQFDQVSIQDLRVTGQSGTSTSLEGVVTFVYPDGSRQLETRSFTVDTGSDPGRITATAFGRVLKPR